MTITAESADGVLHQFPDGTAPAVVDQAMKDYVSNKQPSFMQDAVASPAGRLLHDAVAQPLEGLVSLGLKGVSLATGAPDTSGTFNKDVTAPIEGGYQAALAAQRNVPGYADARAKADSVMANRGSGITDQLTAPFNSAIAGTVGLFGGGMNGANAASDAATASDTAYSTAHPALSTAAQLVGGLAAAPEKAALPALSAPQAVPSIADLKSAAQAAYSKVDNSGLMVSAPSVDNMVSNLQTKLANEGIDSTLHPNATAAFNRLQNATGNNVTFKGMDTLRRVAGDAVGASATNPSDKRMSYIIQNAIDDHVNNLAPSDMVGGQGPTPPDPTQTIADLSNARDLWNRASQASVIQSQIDKAAIKAGGYSQSGIENATRAQFRQLALNDKAMARLSPDVQTAVKQVAAGSPVSNLLRAVGKYAPHGPVATAAGMGVGAMVGGLSGAAEGGLASVAIPMIGEASRTAATAMTKAAAQRALSTALLGKTALPELSVPALRLPALTSASKVPYGLFGASLQQQQPLMQ